MFIFPHTRSTTFLPEAATTRPSGPETPSGSSSLTVALKRHKNMRQGDTRRHTMTQGDTP